MTSGSTKLAAPPVPQLAVLRADLIKRLDDGVRGRLTLVAAPPGFGKTVLLSQWAAGQNGGSRFAWASLVEDDNDGTRLAAHLVDALQSLAPGLGQEALERVEESGAAMGENFLDRLLDELRKLPASTIVLHNVDALTNPTLVDELGVLIEEAPPQISFIIGRHSTWPSGLHGLRLADGDTQLEQADLAFHHDDARALLRRVAAREFSDAQVDTLLVRTEGWAAGLQLAAIKLRHEHDLDRFIDAFHGDDRNVAAYLTEEVLTHQPPFVRKFLLETAVLDQLNGPMCDAVTGTNGGHEMLERLERDGLFLRRLATGDGWFRYHQLFRDLLRHELRTTDPPREAQLLKRAADWHLSHDDLEQAATYLIAAADWDRLIDLIDEHGKSMFERGNASVLLRWVEAMPAALRAGRRDIELRHATLHTIVGNSRRAEEIVVKLMTPSRSMAEAVAIDALRANWVQWHAAPAAVIESADALLANLEVLAPDDIPDLFGLTTPDSLRAMAAVSRARAIWYQGDPVAARVALTAAPDDLYPPWHVNILGASALLDAWTGHLRTAEETARHSLGIAEEANLQLHPSTIDAYLAMAHVLREQNHLRRADRVLDEALARAGRARRSVAQAVHAVERAQWYLATSQPDRGLEMLMRFRTDADVPPPMTIDARMRSVEARLLVATGDLDRAETVLHHNEAPWTSDLAAAAVQVAVARDDESAAKQRRADWPEDLEPGPRLERGLWTSIVESRYGNRREALELLADVVAVAEADGHTRVFIDAGADAARLLQTLYRTSPTPYLRRLAEPSPGAASFFSGAPDLASTLSTRELAVVRYLPSRLSSAQIAEHLYISLNTLKTHLRSIYRKLGVEGRREAIEKAKEQGIA